jgi:hypothetical protein
MRTRRRNVPPPNGADLVVLAGGAAERPPAVEVVDGGDVAVLVHRYVDVVRAVPAMSAVETEERVVDATDVLCVHG